MVGTRSYGKGVFQEEHGLANGGALKLTVGEYFTPNGENLARTGGIHPEVKARRQPEDGGRRGAAEGARNGRRAGRGLSPAPGRGERRGRGRRREAAPRRGSGGARGGGGSRPARGSGARGGTLSRRDAPGSARDAVADLLEERLGLRGFSGLVEEEAMSAAEAAEALGVARRDLTELAHLHRRPGDGARLRRRGLGAARGRRLGASGSISPTSPPTCGRARRSTWRRCGSANSTYVPGTVEPMLPHSLVERGVLSCHRGSNGWR